MRYLIRSLKYLVYFAIIFILIVGVVYMFSSQKLAGLSFVELFQEGSLPKILLFFVVVAAFYPYLSFQKKEMMLDSVASNSDMLDEVMRGFGYVRENPGRGAVSYVKQSVYQRLTRMYEDRITFFEEGGRVYVEGYRKDLLRIISMINYRVREANRSEDE